MRAYFLFALAGCGLLAGGCSSDDESTKQLGCGLSASGAIDATYIEVFGEGGVPLCGARVVLSNGSFAQTLQASDCNSFDLPYRAGSYELTVTKPGYLGVVEPAVTFSQDWGCAGPPSLDVVLKAEAVECKGAAAPSFRVDLRDERGAPVCDASVTVRDGAFTQALQASPAADGTCAWGGLDGRPGAYEVTIAKPDHKTIVLGSVVVTAQPDDCLVSPAAIEATLVRSEPGCWGKKREALDLTVRDETGAEVCDALVRVQDTRSSAKTTLKPVLRNGGCAWTGMLDRDGDFDVTVSKPGYATVTAENVEVSTDGCHVRPVSLEFMLAPVPPTGG